MTAGPVVLSLCVSILIAVIIVGVMGGSWSKNKFPVKGKTVLVTGGSQGMGKALACILAKRGANIIIVARTQRVLEEALKEISVCAASPSTQRFHYISADLSSASEATRVIDQATAWNHSLPPDHVICCAGAAHPSLFTETSTETLKQQFDTNYWSGAYIAHAVIGAWLSQSSSSKSESHKPMETKHLVFTSSIVAFLPLVGYAPYTPSKWALRGLAETLSQELLYYAHHTPIETHCIFPGTILSPGYDNENLTKPAVLKKLEEGEEPQSADKVAQLALDGLDRGEQLITASGLLGTALRVGSLGSSRRAGWGIVDTLMAWAVTIILVIVRRDMDGTVRKFGVAGKA